MSEIDKEETSKVKMEVVVTVNNHPLVDKNTDIVQRAVQAFLEGDGSIVDAEVKRNIETEI